MSSERRDSFCSRDAFYRKSVIVAGRSGFADINGMTRTPGVRMVIRVLDGRVTNSACMLVV